MIPLSKRPALALILAVLAILPTQALSCAQPEGAAALRAQVIGQVNAERKRAGLGALATSSKLQKAAQSHACDIAGQHSISHTGSDGSDLSKRLKRSGYRFRAASENTYRGQSQPVEWWMKSSGHRANILMSNTREMAIGIAISDAPDSRLHWVLVMGASR
ncbi:MAG: CAP domain-containing protein [Paracoccaceae bacterium]